LEAEGGEETQESSSDGEKAAEPSPFITVDRVQIINAAIDFTDQAIDPKVVTGIQNFSGTIQGLSSKELSKADVSLEGRVDNVATLKIQGKVNPLQDDLYTDLTFGSSEFRFNYGVALCGKIYGVPHHQRQAVDRFRL